MRPLRSSPTKPMTWSAPTALALASFRGWRREYLAATGAPPEQVDRMHSAFTKSVMLHLTVWTRAYVDDPTW